MEKLPYKDLAAWRETAARYPVDYFTTTAGQQIALTTYAHLRRPPGWSLPSALGPWPTVPDETAVRLLNFIPGLTASVVGDYLIGPWRFRSSAYTADGEKVLHHLQAAGQASARAATYGEAWFLTKADAAQALDPRKPHEAPVRALLDRFRLAVHDARVAPRLEQRRRRDEGRLAELEQCPPEERDGNWEAEVALYRSIVAAWSEPR